MIITPLDQKKLESIRKEPERKIQRSSSVPLSNAKEGLPDMGIETSLKKLIKKNRWYVMNTGPIWLMGRTTVQDPVDVIPTSSIHACNHLYHWWVAGGLGAPLWLCISERASGDGNRQQPCLQVTIAVPCGRNHHPEITHRHWN
ncbi:hypothetical protein RHSIM_Rhsim06G0031400 [Rhododendron simsii]|uniref:Uncharacterized protein n=1 Tax=Rhododendron simsii TaxID=118357 RepID=A0A834LLI5_RHOSS|nr:hypothetical protein RHSIM_Rhsim06G0031400 [Rhododendron simsii]